MASFGDVFTTPDGQHGIVSREWANDALWIRVPVGNGTRKVLAYPVLLDSGEVRFYSEAALDGNPDIRRSGTLNE